jgi:hypothetical protein
MHGYATAAVALPLVAAFFHTINNETSTMAPTIPPMRGTMPYSNSAAAVARSTSPTVKARFPLPRAISTFGAFALLALAAPAHAQQSDSPQTLILNGQQSSVPVVQMKNRSYVDLDALTRALGGSISYGGNQIALSLPSVNRSSSSDPNANSGPTPATSAPPPPAGFSKAFMSAAIEEAATLREWHAALASAIKNGYPMAPGMFGPYRAQSQTNLRLVSVACSTDSDRNAYALINTLFQNMGALTDRYLDKRANMTYISPDSLDNDGLNQRIVTCGHSLSAMAASGQFNDDGSCR